MTTLAQPGCLITFEGLGGCGKSTLVRRLAAWLEQASLPIALTREPGGTPLGANLRGLLLEKGAVPVPWAEAFLFEADRAQTYAEVIIPALRDGKIVISDRNYYGTVAYQGFGRALDLDLIDRMTRAATGGHWPTLVVVLDVDPAIGLRRKYGQDAVDRFDEEDLAFQQRVREGYLFAAQRDPHAHVVDAARAADDVFRDVCGIAAAALADRLPPHVLEGHR